VSDRGIRFRSARARRLAERALVRGLGPRQARRLQRVLERDPEGQDRQAYGRLVALFRAMEGDPPLTAGQNQRILEGIKRGIGAPSAARAPGWLPRLAPALAASVLALLTTLTLLTGPPIEPGPDGLQARGQSDNSLAGGGEVDLRALCVRDGQVVRAPVRSGPRSPDARCRLSDELQLMLTHQADYPYLLVIGQQRTDNGEYRRLWYHPVPPTGHSGAALLGENEPLGQAVNLDVNHLPGEVRVVGLWSRSPMEVELVHAWLEAIGWEQSLEQVVDRMGQGNQIEVVEQRVMIIDNISEVR
jgi:hypothetical protein